MLIGSMRFFVLMVTDAFILADTYRPLLGAARQLLTAFIFDQHFCMIQSFLLDKQRGR